MAMLNNQRVEVQPQMWYFTCFNSGKLYQISQKKKQINCQLKSTRNSWS